MTPQVIWAGISAGLYGVAVIYIVASLIAGQFLRLRAYDLLLNMSAAFLVMVFCEVGTAYFYNTVMGRAFWMYRVWPVHGGYTSGLSIMIWPIYGFYLYLLAEVLRVRGFAHGNRWHHGVFSGVDGPVLEILANGFFILFFGTYYFYYFPTDMRHFTSIQVVPFYMAAGVMLTLILRYLRSLPHNWLYPTVLYVAGCVFVLID